MEKSKKKEIKRLRHMLSEIVGLAEDQEMEGGLPNAVKRYNAIVRHLEQLGVLTPGLIQHLSEEAGAVNFHQVGAECRMLSGYLEEVIEEEDESDARKKADFGPVIALAPFLEQSDLKKLIDVHLSGRGFAEAQSREEESRQGPPDLKTLVGLAPHISKRDLAEMVEACLVREPITDPHVLLGLAPHMDRQDLSRLLRQYAPAWFGPKGEGEPAYRPEEAPSNFPQTTPAAPETFER